MGVAPNHPAIGMFHYKPSKNHPAISSTSMKARKPPDAAAKPGVSGLVWFGTCFMTFHILGISSSQLTLSDELIFFRGVGKPPTRKLSQPTWEPTLQERLGGPSRYSKNRKWMSCKPLTGLTSPAAQLPHDD